MVPILPGKIETLSLICVFCLCCAAAAMSHRLPFPAFLRAEGRCIFGVFLSCAGGIPRVRILYGFSDTG